MSRPRKRKRPRSRHRRSIPADMQVRPLGPSALEEFFRFGGPPVFPCGCSAHDAVEIRPSDVGSAAYPTGDGLNRYDIDEIQNSWDAKLVVWWHNCPGGENVVIRSPLEAF